MKWSVGGGVLAVVLMLALSGVAGAATPAPVPTKQDTASTKAFIALQQRYDIGATRSAAAINAAEHAFAAQIRAGCPGALKGLPKKLSHRQAEAASNFLFESLLALDINAFAPLRGLTERLAGQQQRLRFSAPALQWQVHVNGAATAAYFALRPPDLCADARLLASSGFARITPAGAQFVHDAATLDTSATVSPSSLLRAMRSYAPAATAVALKRLPELQHALDRKIPINHEFRTLLGVLGLARLAASPSARPGVGS
jgi:hypothetical protein